MGEIRRISDDRMMERSKRLATLFCRTEFISVDLGVDIPSIGPSFLVRLVDTGGDGLFTIEGSSRRRPNARILNEITSYFPFPIDPGSVVIGGGGGGGGRYSRWYHANHTPPGEEVVDTFTKRGGDLAWVTKRARDAYTIFFYNLLQNKWIEIRMFDYFARDRDNPVPLNVDCEYCESVLEKVYTCAKCRKPKYCGKACQVSHWHAGHKKDCLQQ